MTINHPTDSRLTFEVEHHPAEKREGEWNYSLGVPSRDEWYEITGVSFDNGEVVADITEFVIHYCDHLLSKWEEQLVG